MPRYNPASIEPKWQEYWEQNRTFAAPRLPTGPKIYVLDMFPYPSGDGLHVGHPEGYTATDIVCRYQRMRGKSVMHPMGWDAFGLPAEQHAKKTGTPPRVTTEKNIATFRRQLKMLGFSYDWDRELATTDVDYFRWTQWIFLQLFDTWFDVDEQRGRPIAELPIPAEVSKAGEAAVRRYQDEHRLAYQLEAPVNWCPALGTVLANEEVQGGVSERGGHPVVRIPLRQWMLRITAYADRLEEDLAEVDWSEGVKALQRNWIGRSTGAEVDFFIGRGKEQSPNGKPAPLAFKAWRTERGNAGFPRTAPDDVLRIYTTRPDTLFGATYMVVAPEHPFVERLTQPDQAAAVKAYCEQAARKSDLDRTDLAKKKTGVFTGSFAVNPANQRPVPVWVADYVLAGYGTGAIMAVPAHDKRDFEFAVEFNLPIVQVVRHPPSDGYSNKFLDFTDQFYARPSYTLAAHVPVSNADSKTGVIEDKIRDANLNEFVEIHRNDDGVYVILKEPVRSPSCLNLSNPIWWRGLAEAYTHEGVAINSSNYSGVTTAEFKTKIVADLAPRGTGRAAVNYKLRDWLFSRQHVWGEPFPILHELKDGMLSGLTRTIRDRELPVELPQMAHYQNYGTVEPPLEQAPEDWLYLEIEGVGYKRETNTMPQWAGSCWYYLRFLDPKNDKAFIDPEIERAWMPVDLYIGGAEHAVLHLLYARFWHKVLYDRGHVSTKEPFKKLVNQGMILGEIEYRVVEYDVPVRLDASGSPTEEFVSSDTARAETEEADQSLATAGAGDAILIDEETNTIRGVFGLKPVPKEEVYIRGGTTYWKHEGQEYEVEGRTYKMSKSRGNVVNPDKVVQEYGADSLRLYEMFMGPLEATKPWSMEGVNGVRGFLDRVWRMIVNERAEQIELNAAVQDIEPTVEQNRLLHKTIQAVTQDLDRLSFNTSIAKLMEFTNYFTRCDVRPKAAMEQLCLLLAPLAPHIAEELWQLLGHANTLAYEPWPQFDPVLVKDDTLEIPVQINGKLRGRILVPADLSREATEAAARADERIAEQLAGVVVKKVVVVPGRMVNFVVG